MCKCTLFPFIFSLAICVLLQLNQLLAWLGLARASFSSSCCHIFAPCYFTFCFRCTTFTGSFRSDSLRIELCHVFFTNVIVFAPRLFHFNKISNNNKQQKQSSIVWADAQMNKTIAYLLEKGKKPNGLFCPSFRKIIWNGENQLSEREENQPTGNQNKTDIKFHLASIASFIDNWMRK